MYTILFLHFNFFYYLGINKQPSRAISLFDVIKVVMQKGVKEATH